MYNDAYFLFNSVDLSDHVKSLELTYEAEDLDDTAMNDTSRSHIGGLKNWKVSITVNQDFAASEFDATVFSRIGTSTAVEIRPTDAAVGATNPKFTGNVIPLTYTPLTGEVGSLASATLELTGTGDLTRATA